MRSRVRIPLAPLGNVACTPLCQCLSEDTGKCWSILSDIYARGNKRSHTGGKSVTCHECHTLHGQYNTIRYETIRYDTMRYDTIVYAIILIRYHAIPNDTMRCEARRCDAMQYNTIQYNTIQYNTMQYNGEI